MPNFSNLSYHQKLDFLTQWLRDCGPGHKISFAQTVARLKHFDEFQSDIHSHIESFGQNPQRPPTLFQCRLKLMQEWFTEWNSDQRQEFFRSINQADSDLNAMVENLQLDDLHVQVDHLVEEPQMNGHIEDSVLATLVTTAARRTELSSPAKESPLPSPQTSPKTKVEQTSDENPPENLSGDEEIL